MQRSGVAPAIRDNVEIRQLAPRGVPNTRARLRSSSFLVLALALATGCASGEMLEPETNAAEEGAPDDAASGPRESSPRADAGKLSTKPGHGHAEEEPHGDDGSHEPTTAEAGSRTLSDDAGAASTHAGAVGPHADAASPQVEVDAGPSAPAVRTPDAALPPPPPPPGPMSAHENAHYYVEKGRIYDGCGEELIMRGVNHPTIYTDRAGVSLPEIAKTGANTVRLFWFGTHGISINELEPAIAKSVAQGMLPVIEMHDSTCKWNIDPIVEQWVKPDAVALIKKHEKHIIVNIANEASAPNNDEFVKSYTRAIVRMREAGIHVPLMIDAGRCGRDAGQVLDKGPELLKADPDRNLIFSAHLYDPLTKSQFAAIFDRARALELPFIVGEMAHREPPGCGKPIDYGAIMTEAQRTGHGWLAWSWGDNNPSTNWNGDCGEYDMADTFSFDSLRGWGRDAALTHPASIEKTSKRPFALTHGDRCASE